MKRLFGCLKFKNKKSKVMFGKKVKLVRRKDECRPHSSNLYIGSDREFLVSDASGISGSAWIIKDIFGVQYGWVYEWEMEEIGSSKESFEKKIEDLKSEMEEVQRKIDFLNETKSEIFDTEEYKVYSTLKLFQNEKLTDVEKSKLIAKLIKDK
jgi:hypothetical protein